MSVRPALWSPLVLAGLLSLFCWGCQEQSTAKTADVPLSSPDVAIKLYLGDGTDVTGKLQSATPKSFFLDTGKDAPETIDRTKVQGLILATETEQQVADKITTDPQLWIAAGQYIHATRQVITSHLKHVPCDTGNITVVHGQLNKAGNLLDLKLLASSGCKKLDEAVVAAFRQTEFKPLPKIYPLEVYPVNYYYEPEITLKDPKKPEAKTEQSAADPSLR